MSDVSDGPSQPSLTADGWTELPPLTDGARYEFNGSIAQIEGVLAPVVDIRLSEGSGVMFDHHRLLWTTPTTTLRAGSSQGMYSRSYAGLPSILMHAEGPGQVGFSHHHHAGEIVALTLDHGQGVAVHDGKLLVADHTLSMGYSNNVPWYQHQSGNDIENFFPLRSNIELFIAEHGPGMLFLHSVGNAYRRDLRAGEGVVFAPGAFLAATVGISVDMVRWRSARPWGSGASVLLYVTGPGTVWVESGAWHEIETHNEYGLINVEGAISLAHSWNRLQV